MHWDSSWFQKPHGIYFLWLGHGLGLQQQGLVPYTSLPYVYCLWIFTMGPSLLRTFCFPDIITCTCCLTHISFYPCFIKFFVIGHDCAHKAFSSNKLVEDIVGTLAFLPLIYPYEPWRFKHDQHHAKTNMCVQFCLLFFLLNYLKCIGYTFRHTFSPIYYGTCDMWNISNTYTTSVLFCLSSIPFLVTWKSLSNLSQCSLFY